MNQNFISMTMVTILYYLKRVYENEMELVDCNIYRYNNSIEQELEPTEVDDLSGVSWPHSENENTSGRIIKINQIDNSTNNTETKERNYTTDRSEDREGG